MPDTALPTSAPSPPSPAPRRRLQKRSDAVAEALKRWMVDQAAGSGHRLPTEKQIQELFGASKGTVREALKALEVQGLIRLKTGPGGGAVVTAVTPDRAMALLGNYFQGRDVSLRDVYALRKVLEPMLAETVAGHLSEADFAALERSLDVCACHPLGPEADRRQRLAELDFHEILADACRNPILGFTCRFLTATLRSLGICQPIYLQPQKDLADSGYRHHVALLAAFRAGDGVAARAVMQEHMEDAERLMLQRQPADEPLYPLADLRGQAG